MKSISEMGIKTAALAKSDDAGLEPVVFMAKVAQVMEDFMDDSYDLDHDNLVEGAKDGCIFVYSARKEQSMRMLKSVAVNSAIQFNVFPLKSKPASY